MKVAMKIPYKVSEPKDEYNKSYGAIDLASLLSHAQSQSPSHLATPKTKVANSVKFMQQN